MKIQSFRLYFTSRFSSRRVRQAFIGKECGFHLLSIKTTQILPGSPKNIQKSTGIHLKKLTYTQKKKKKKKSACAKEIHRFQIAKSKKFYGSSKSRESWLEKLRVTQFTIRWNLTCRIQRFFRQTFQPTSQRSDRAKEEYIEGSLESLLSVSIKFRKTILS